MSRPMTNDANAEDMQDDSTARMLFGSNDSGVLNNLNGKIDTENHADDVEDPESPGDVVEMES